ncbi:MAG: alpha/beta hydrolase [Pseudomonadales bacterium]
MSTKHLLAEDLQSIADLVPEIDFTADMLPRFRQAQARNIKLEDQAKYEVERREILIKVIDQPDVRGLLYVPQSTSGTGYLHLHGGGYIIGAPEGSDLRNLRLASELGVVILSIDYRLAPENPFPAPLDDCCAGLAWLHDNAAELGVDANRIAVGGESAGAGLAAALAIHMRGVGELAICHQHLTFPMLDNLTGNEDHPGDPLVGEFVWTRNNNQFAWQSYLGDQPAIAPQVPARAQSFESLPQAWIYTVGQDLFRDENILFAQNLMRAGVDVELVVYPGACHGFQMVPNSRASKVYDRAHREGLAVGLGLQA